MKKNGCYFVRHGKGDHDIWYSPITNTNITVDGKIKSRYTAREGARHRDGNVIYFFGYQLDQA